MSLPDITMSEGPKADALPGSTSHILFDGLEETIFCFSSVQTSIKSEIPAIIEFFAILQRQSRVHSSQVKILVFSTNVYNGS